MRNTALTSLKEVRSLKLKKRGRTTNVIPGFKLTLGITILMVSLLILIPLASVLVFSFRLSPAEFIKLITAKNVVSALICSLIAALINSVFGLILAWVLVKYDFPGKRILDGLIELPFALPTAVAGITLSKMYSNTGFPGKYFSSIGIDVSYTKIGIVIALVFIGIPFTVRAVQPVLEKLDPQYEEAAYILGANSKTTFFKVIFPELFPSLLTGFGLALARGIGEYGSVIYISGNSAKDGTQVVSYVIMQKLERMDYASATAIALVLLIISFTLLFVINIIQIRRAKRISAR